MSSRFPGMDPYIESQKWTDFPTRMIAAIADAIVPRVRPSYVVEVERRIYIESHDPLNPVQNFVADAALFKSGLPQNALGGSGVGGVAVVAESVSSKPCTVPFPEEHREVFLTIRRGEIADVVTVIELLSPANKRQGTDGQGMHLLG